jgi:hypothetical protein
MVNVMIPYTQKELITEIPMVDSTMYINEGKSTTRQNGMKRNSSNPELEAESDVVDDARNENDSKPSSGHQIAGLKCDAYGGPSEEDAAEMIYWEDIPSDAKYVSPLKASGPEYKYLTFEPDEGETNFVIFPFIVHNYNESLS